MVGTVLHSIVLLRTTISVASWPSILWPSSNQQKHNSWIFIVFHLCCLLIFFYIPQYQTLHFSPQILQHPESVLAWYVILPDRSFFPGTHKLFYEPLFDTLIRLLSTLLVFLQMVVFSFYKSIFHIVSELSLATSFLVPHIINHLSILYSLLFLQVNDGYLKSVWKFLQTLKLLYFTGVRFSNSSK